MLLSQKHHPAPSRKPVLDETGCHGINLCASETRDKNKNQGRLKTKLTELIENTCKQLFEKTPKERDLCKVSLQNGLTWQRGERQSHRGSTENSSHAVCDLTPPET